MIKRPMVDKSTGKRKLYRKSARRRLAFFRKSSSLALALTSLLLLLGDSLYSAPKAETKKELGAETAKSLDEAQGAIEGLFSDFAGLLPKLSVAIGILFVIWLLARLFQNLYQRIQPNYHKRGAVITLTKLFLYFAGILLSVTVVAGDARALLGSVGLIGLALSWTLQQPIESFSGYLLNAFRSYYRVGDRIQVGDALGDVYRIDLLTTTIWEIGGPGKSVKGSQFTGSMITFPNSEVMRSNIVNFSQDFPYVWDEIAIGVTNESDLGLSAKVIQDTANKLIGNSMRESALTYRRLLSARGLDYNIEEQPQVYLSPNQSWTDCSIRYLVEIRKKRVWASLIYEKISEEISKPEHKGKITPAYPKSIVETSPRRLQ